MSSPIIKESVKKKVRGFLIILAIWTFLAVLVTSQTYYISSLLSSDSGETALGTHQSTPNWMPIFWHQFTSYMVWAFLTPIVFWFGRKFSFSRKNWLKPLILHLAAIFFIVSLHSVMTILLHSLFTNNSSPFLSINYFLSHFVIGRIYSKGAIYFTLVIISYSLNYYSKLREKELQSTKLENSLVSARLQTLQMKLQPHFLFNTLNSISLLAVNNKTGAIRELVDRLGKLLRKSMGGGDKQLVKLKDELEILNCYLDIEKLRFRDRLKIIEDIDDSTLNAAVPHLCLQPLVENGFKHAFSKKIDSGLLEIKIARKEDNLLILISDDGPGLPEDFDLNSQCGIGLKNTIERLEILYPDSYSFRLFNGLEKGALVELIIPFQEFSSLLESEME